MTVNPEESAITYRRIDPADGESSAWKLTRYELNGVDDEFEVAVQVMISSFSVSKYHLSSFPSARDFPIRTSLTVSANMGQVLPR